MDPQSRQADSSQVPGRSWTPWIGVLTALIVFLPRILSADRDSLSVWPIVFIWLLVVFGYPIERDLRLRRVVRRFQTNDQLTAYASQASRSTRQTLVWIECVIARRVVAGTYAGEPPATFLSEADQLSKLLSPGTRRQFKIVAWVCMAMFVLVMAVVLSSHSSMSDNLYAAAYIAVLLALIVALYYPFWRWRSQRSFYLLGGQVESASAIASSDRWELLLALARDELGVTLHG